MLRKHIVALLLSAFVFAIATAMMTDEACAIPAFARKYQTCCQTCHIAYPKLNSFGEAFRNNGYRFPAGDEEVIKDEPVSLGAPAWKKVWPDAVWPSDIPGLPPLTLVVSNRYEIRPDDPVNNEFILPSEIEMISGGTLGEDASFYAALTLLEENEFGGLHRLFGQFDSLASTPLLNIKFGGFEPRAIPFSSHRRLTKTNYLMNTLTTGIDSAMAGELDFGAGHGHGGGGQSPFSASQRGVEVWGVTDGFKGGGFAYAFGVVNGNGLGGFTFVAGDEQGEEHDEGAAQFGPRFPSGEDGEDDEHAEGPDEHGESGLTFLDNNSRKDFYWRAYYKFGGATLTGREISQISDSENWVDNSLRIGTFGFRGQSQGGESFRDPEDFTRYGVDFDLWFEDLNLFGAALWGKHERGSGDELLEFDMRTWFIEADYVWKPWVIPAIRYEVAEFDPVTVAGLPEDQSLPRIERLVPSVTMLLRANMRFTIEGNKHLNNVANDLVRFDIDFAF